ncbi:MAG: hypothetical protein MUF13_12680 [Akkermansiaceae bacterium]|nr:hypothetical protein [Akkermansiaceae bacterium]
MKKILLLTLLASAPALFAQDGPPPEGEGRPGPVGRPGPRMPHPLMAALDTDKDGALSAEEIAAAPESLAKLDKNGDGKLDRGELFPPPPKGQRPPRGQRQGDPDGEGPPPPPPGDEAE